MNNRSPSGGGGGMSASGTLFLLVAVVGAMTAGGYVHYKRTQTQMRDQVCLCTLYDDGGGCDVLVDACLTSESWLVTLSVCLLA